MKKQFRDYISFGATMVVILMVTGGAFAAEKATDKEVKKDKVQLPDNIKELTAMETELIMKAKVVSDQLFQVLTDIRLEKSKVTRTDPEIKALSDEINKLQAKVAKLTLEKSKDMSGWTKKSETLIEQHDNLRTELMAVKAKKATLLNKSKINK